VRYDSMSYFSFHQRPKYKVRIFRELVRTRLVHCDSLSFFRMEHRPLMCLCHWNWISENHHVICDVTDSLPFRIYFPITTIDLAFVLENGKLSSSALFPWTAERNIDWKYRHTDREQANSCISQCLFTCHSIHVH
jgi:hypothetical protein